MMTQLELKQIFQNPYERKAWLEVLKNVFSKVSIFAQPQDLFQEVDAVIEGSQIGLIQLTDDKNIAIFEVEVADNISILHNRKGLRDIAAKHIDQGIIHGALVFFYSQCQSEYRFTFIAKHTEFDDEGNLNKIQTHPKRYTYVLGTPYCGTAIQRISTLAVKNQLSPLVIKDVIEAFSVEALTKEFYSELSNWYFWALQNVKFPDDFEQDEEVRNATSTIRLITRLMFVWFLKQKGLIPDGLFDKEELKKILNYSDKTGSTFYKAILQNLFFATLNTEMSGDKRKFINRQYGVQGFYRYERFFSNKERFLELTKDIPFLNGGLFENLDKNVGETNEIRIDCFSNKVTNENRLSVPDYLFYDGAEHADLSRAYGDNNHGNTKVRGLIEILKSYNFTIEENTPYEIEVALDPELLGKVFENLLASYNPETKTTARKQTGSFYTPREIVNYMVDESILAYLKNCLNLDFQDSGINTIEKKSDNQVNPMNPNSDNEGKFRQLLAYNGDENPFDAKDTAILIKAIDNCKILDPACGSGAFPMGVLQKMVHILQKLDKDNSQWRELQRQKAIAETEKAYNIGDKDERQKRLLDIDETFDYNTSDYGRKLYLIENCIYGVDIQPIAVQIAKLRFFISLVCDQKDDKNRENLGIRPLPNLETKFVAANSLIDINRSGGVLRILEVVEKEKELADVRHKHFLARTPETKAKYRKKDEELRHHIATLLKNNGWGDAVAKQLADWNPYDQNTSASFFDPEWMFGLSSEIVIQKSNVPSTEIKALNLQLESINKQIDTINLSLQSNHAPEILKLQFVSANIQVSIIELEVNRLKSNIDELYGSVNSKVGNVVKEPVDVTYLINSLNQAIKQINKQIADFEAKLKPVQKIENYDGFDILIGNPPYGAKFNNEHKKIFKELYKNQDYQLESYLLFIEKGISLLKYKGVLSYIIPNTWLSNLMTKKIRKYIFSNTKIIEIIHFKDSVFEAVVDTEIFLCERKETIDNHVKITIRENKISTTKFTPQKKFKDANGMPINVFADESTLIINQKFQNSEKLESICKITQGTKPFQVGKGNPKQTQEIVNSKEFVSEYQKDNSYRPLLRGSLMNKYSILWNKNYWIKFGNWLAEPRYSAGFDEEKIIIRQTGDSLIATIDTEKYIVRDNLYTIQLSNKTTTLQYILALLNSKLLNWYYQNILNPEKGEVLAQVKRGHLAILPIKIHKNQQPFITLVDRILAAKKADPQSDTLLWEAEIDARVFQLYGLTEEEMLQVLNSLPSVSEGERREIMAQSRNLK